MKLKTQTNRPDGFRQRWFTTKPEAERWARAYKGSVLETSPGMVWCASYFIAPRVQDARCTLGSHYGCSCSARVIDSRCEGDSQHYGCSCSRSERSAA
jgi:hypothetical protein